MSLEFMYNQNMIKKQHFIIWIYTFICIHENRWSLQRHCRRCSKKVWYFKLWVKQTITKRERKKVSGLVKVELGGKNIKKMLDYQWKPIVT